MKRSMLTLAGALLAAFAGTFSSISVRALENGFYRTSDLPTPTVLTTLDDQKVYLAGKVPDNLKGGRLTSQNNDNSCYQLEVFRNASASVDNGHLVLVLTGKCCRFLGWGGDATHSNLVGTICDQSFVGLVEAYLKITRTDRHHPGHQFNAQFASDPSGYALSNTKTVTLEITNCGSRSFYIEDPTVPTGSLDSFSFTAFRTGPNESGRDNAVANKPYFIGAGEVRSTTVEIKPGATQSISVDLNRFLNFAKRGTYAVRGSHEFHLVEGASQFATIWDDFATADFEVKIR